MNNLFNKKIKIKSFFYLDYSYIVFIILMLFTANYLLLLIISISILIHEFAHIMIYKIITKRRTKIKLELTIFGGVTKLDLDNLSSYKQVVIYFAGVLSNFLIIVLIWLLNYFFYIDTELYYLVIQYNFIMLCFSLLPIYPLDGYFIVKNLVSERFIFYISIIYLLIFLIISIYLSSIALIFISIFLIFKNINRRKEESAQKKLKFLSQFVANSNKTWYNV